MDLIERIAAEAEGHTHRSPCPLAEIVFVAAVVVVAAPKIVRKDSFADVLVLHHSSSVVVDTAGHRLARTPEQSAAGIVVVPWAAG